MNQVEIDSNRISTFGSASNAQTVDQQIVLTTIQLQMIIQQAIAPFVAEINELKKRIAELESRLSLADNDTKHEISPGKHDISDPALAKTAEYDISLLNAPATLGISPHDLEIVKNELSQRIDEMYVDLQLEIAQDRRRITKLETPVYGTRSRKRVDELHRAMAKNGLRQITFTQAAKLLGVTYRHARRLHPLIEDDPRFVVLRDPRHKNRNLIRLTDDMNRGS